MLAKIIAGEADIALGIEKNSKFAKHVIFPRLPTYILKIIVLWDCQASFQILIHSHLKKLLAHN